MNPVPGIGMQKCAARLVAALAVVAVLFLAVGCGSSRHTNPGGSNLGFTNASLSGHYAFTLRGVGTPDNANAFFFIEGGVFTADGNGNLTSITDDFIENFQPGLNNQATGTYTIRGDGSGDVAFNFGANGVAQYHITLSDDSHFYMEEDEGFNTSAGSGEKQDTSTFGTIPSGTFVMQTHDLIAGNSKVGVATWNAGQITGTGDVLSGGVVTSVTISGTAQTSGSSTGRGTVTITDDTGTSHYVYYVVNSSRLRLFNTDNLISLGLGQAEAQTGGPFSTSSLNGSYVFGSAGETTNVDGIHTVGLFATDGAGNVTSGSFDFVQDGNVVTGITLAPSPPSSYTVNGNGHAVVNLNLSTGATNVKHMFLVNPSRAFFLVDDPGNIEDGTLDKQTGTFSNGSLNGQAAFFMDGFDGVYKDRVGTLTPNGSGNVNTAYISSFFDPVNIIGGAKAFTFSGTYGVTGNGRATAQFPGFTNNLIFYLSSSDTGYFLQADSGIDFGGALKLQTGP